MKRIVVIAIGMLAAVASAHADNGVRTIPSKYSVPETIDRLESVARAEKFQVFARIDFQALAAANGAAVKPNQILLFGRGGALPPLLPSAPIVALDLPLKALAWEDANGKVWLSFNTGEYLKQRHPLEAKDDVLRRLTEVTMALVQKAVD